MYNSIVEQLKFLKNYLNGTDKDRSRLMRLMFGAYAAKELEVSDPDFAEVLHKAFYVATQEKKGLKIDGKVLNG